MTSGSNCGCGLPHLSSGHDAASNEAEKSACILYQRRRSLEGPIPHRGPLCPGKNPRLRTLLRNWMVSPVPIPSSGMDCGSTESACAIL